MELWVAYCQNKSETRAVVPGLWFTGLLPSLVFITQPPELNNFWKLRAMKIPADGQYTGVCYYAINNVTVRPVCNGIPKNISISFPFQTGIRLTLVLGRVCKMLSTSQVRNSYVHYSVVEQDTLFSFIYLLFLCFRWFKVVWTHFPDSWT
jgi:hypothetical protein